MKSGREGYLDRAQLIDRYAAASGRDVSEIAYFEAFALFKIAVVIQQIYYRFRQGQTDDPRFAGLGDRVAALAARAEQRSADCTIKLIARRYLMPGADGVR